MAVVGKLRNRVSQRKAKAHKLRKYAVDWQDYLPMCRLTVLWGLSGLVKGGMLLVLHPKGSGALSDSRLCPVQ